MKATCSRPATQRVKRERSSCYPRPGYISLRVGILLVALLTTALSSAEEEQNQKKTEPSEPDLTGRSLEELMNTEVTTGARHPEKVSGSPAAISVITQEDIRRSGVITLPEALRLAPGLE